MPNLVNIHAEQDANIIGDDAQPTLALSNSSTGHGLQVDNLYVSNSARSSIITAPALTIRRTLPGNISIGTLRISGNSTASGAVLDFVEKGFVSITSVVLTTVSNTDYAIRVQVGTETRWIPCFKDAAIIGAASFA